MFYFFRDENFENKKKQKNFLTDEHSLGNFSSDTDIANNCNVAISAAKKSINSSYDIVNGRNIEREEYAKTFNSEVRRKTLERYRK